MSGKDRDNERAALDHCLLCFQLEAKRKPARLKKVTRMLNFDRGPLP